MTNIVDEAQKIIDDYGKRMERTERRRTSIKLLAAMALVTGAALFCIAFLNI